MKVYQSYFKDSLSFLLAYNCPTFCGVGLAEMGEAVADLQDFVADQILGSGQQSADCPRWQELTLKASAGVWKTSTLYVACACFSPAKGGGS